MILLRLNYSLRQFYDEIKNSNKQQVAKQITKCNFRWRTISLIQTRAILQNLSL